MGKSDWTSTGIQDFLFGLLAVISIYLSFVFIEYSGNKSIKKNEIFLFF
jgi:hypothetical protein